MNLGDSYPMVLDKVLKNLLKKDILNAYNNKNRQKILDILKNSKKPMSIKAIADKMTIKYKSVYEHIQVLESAGLIKTKKYEALSGQPVMVTYIGFNAELMKELSK